MKFKIMDGNEASTYVSYHFTEIAGIYPITPASAMAEYADKWASEGKTNFFGDKVKVVEMESEAGAIAMVHGALQNGTLATTYTASQGLLLMIPNMYKIAGELLPCVINVSARALATHALSILGDHQDIYSTRATGWAMLGASSVQQVMDLTSVGYLATLKGKIPFINFFDGFRTSHELQKVELIDMDKVKELIDMDSLNDFRKRALSTNKVTRGTNQNDDIYFQITEAHNKYYDALPDIVNEYMKDISKITGRIYKPFNYYGAIDATKVIVAMGSVSETIRETIDCLVDSGEKVGLMEVHLYRPFSAKYFLDELPTSVKSIAVLDRTKEAGASEPLFLDVVNVINEAGKDIKVIGGRYGLASKNTTPFHINAVYKYMDNEDSASNFTIGITDDVTNLSLKPVEFEIKSNNHEVLIYGFGSDGMVSASKDIIKIVGSNSNAFAQGYFQYDSKKSRGLTMCHLRFGNEPIKSTYYVENPSLVVCTEESYLRKYRMLLNIEENGTFLLNTTCTKEEVLAKLSVRDKNILKEKNIKFYIVNATKIALEVGLGNKINTIVSTCLFKVGNLIDAEFAIDEMKKSLEVLFTNKGKEVIEKNVNAINRALETLELVDVDGIKVENIEEKDRTLFEIISAHEGNNLTVKELEKYVDGTFEGGLSKLEKRDVAEELPCFNPANCIMCNQCSFVCPHAVVRPFLLNEEEEKNAPESVKNTLMPSGIENYKFTIGISLKDCTGCGLCSKMCPGKKGEKAITMAPSAEVKTEENIEYNDYLFNNVTPKEVANKFTLKGSQFARPTFEFSGACAGCGETPYIKLLTQLYGKELVIANATGCSSIYGGDIPGTAYSNPWMNSLFEDNAEFGMGIEVANKYHKDRVIDIIKANLDKLPTDLKETYTSYAENPTYETSIFVYDSVEKTNIKELIELKEFIKTKSTWIIGGDGWAYDIGYNGLDHVLSTRENVNILVLDTEVYSNTGGQSSKSSRTGSIAKFTATGKENTKKDLAKMALCYPHVYVATISLGANMMQTIKAFKEAKEYNGPSIIIAYSPCIAQGIKGGMSNSIDAEKNATAAGYFPLFRYNPVTEEFNMDSQSDFSKYLDFLKNESRYTTLEKLNPNRYEEFLNINKEDAERRYEYYQKLAKKDE